MDGEPARRELVGGGLKLAERPPPPACQIGSLGLSDTGHVRLEVRDASQKPTLSLVIAHLTPRKDVATMPDLRLKLHVGAPELLSELTAGSGLDVLAWFDSSTRREPEH